MHRRASCLLAAAFQLYGVDVGIYSEFYPTASTREVLSPAVVRNAFATFHVAVTAPPKALYFLAVQMNPPGMLDAKLYRRSFPQPLIEERDPSFVAGVGNGAYLLDVWVPPDANPGIVRLEVLVKTAYWKIAPMEIRILPASVPRLAICLGPEQARDRGAFDILLDGLASDGSKCAPPVSSTLSVIRRNAMQDAALARTLDSRVQRELMGRAIAAYSNAEWTLLGPGGGDSYLAIRRWLFREASTHTRM